MIRVLLIHTHGPTRERLRIALSAAPGLRVVGHTADAVQAVAAARIRPPDVVVMGVAPRDVASDGPSGPLGVHAPLIVFVPSPEPLEAGRLAHGRAAGYLCPATSTRDVVDAIRTVHSGDRYICPHVRHALQQARRGQRETAERLSRLTERELQLLREIASGKPNRDIAHILGLSPKTVSTHRMHILAKLGLHSSVELARFAIEYDLLD